MTFKIKPATFTYYNKMYWIINIVRYLHGNKYFNILFLRTLRLKPNMISKTDWRHKNNILNDMVC